MFVGYKKAIVPELNLPVIVTIELPVHAKHNIHRKTNIANGCQNYAKFRCSCCLVLEIKHADTGARFPRAISLRDSTEYVVGRLVIAKNYEEDPEIICGGGIHFFLSYYRARMYKAPIYDNHFQMWFDNGITKYYGETVGNVVHGTFIEYNSKGQVVRQLQVINNHVIKAIICSWLFTNRKTEGLFEEIHYRPNTMIWDIIPCLKKICR